MSKPNAADLPGSMAVLGLVIEEPDLTVAEIAERLKERFPSCRFDRKTAGTVLQQMANGGRRSRPRVRCIHREPGRSRMRDRYRATQAGIEEFRGWMYAMPVGTPALREALYGRIELCKVQDLPELIRIAREERAVAADLFSNAKSTLQLHLDRNRRRVKPEEPPGPDQFLQDIRNVLLHVTPEYWSWRSSHYDEIGRRLEGIADRAGIEFAPEP